MSGDQLEKTVSRQSLAVSLAGLPVQPPTIEEDSHTQDDDGKDVKEESSSAPVEAKEGFQITDQTLLLPTKRLLIVLAAASTCILLSFLDQTIVATALPTISSYFGGGKDAAWVATAYLVASTSTAPLYGRMSDIFGRKIVLLVAVSMFTVFSLACALARTMLQLIIFRGCQGAFGGGLLTMVMIIMADLISLKDRGKFQGIVEGMIAIANGVGPIVGAVFSEKASWRWCFWINLPLCGISLTALFVFLPSKPTDGNMKAKLKAVDYGGSIASLVATVLLLMGVTWGGTTYAWVSPQVLVPIVLAGVLFVGFVIWEGKVASHPVIPLKVFGNPTSAALQASSFLLGSAYYILLFMIPQFLQTVQGFSAIRASLLLLPFVLMVTIVVESSGLVISKWGRYREFIIFGFATWAAGCGSLTSLRVDAHIGKIIGFLLLCGIGAGLVVQTTVIALMAVCEDRKEVSVALSTRNYLRLLGGSIFLAIATTIVNNGFRSRLNGIIEPSVLQLILDDPVYIQHTLKTTLDQATFQVIIDAYIGAFRTLFFVTMGLLLAALALTVVFVKHHSLKRDDDQKLKEEGRKYVADQKLKRGKKGQQAIEEV